MSLPQLSPSAWLAALAAAIFAAGLYWLPRLQAHVDSPVAAVFPPWWSEEEGFRAASNVGVAVIGAGRLPGVIVVASHDLAALMNLYDAGAWGLIGNDGAAACSSFTDLNRIAQRGEKL